MATYYISPSGNNANAGTYASPWRTLAYAYTNSTTGDTIVFKNGTYAVSTELAFNQTISSRTMQGETAGSVILDWTGTMTNHAWVMATNTTTNIQNFIFKNLTIPSSNYTLLRSSATSNAPTINVSNCVFRDIVTYMNGGLYGGTIIGGGQGAYGNYTFTNCLFYGISKNASASSSSGVFASREATETYTLTNCVFYLSATGSNALGYFMANQGSPTMVLKNCIIQNQSGSTFDFRLNSGGTNVSFTYNNNCAYAGSGSISNVPSGSNNITSDPLFVDAANANFKLRPTSPCIDTGVIV